jgi:hypothetical protein
MNFFGLGNNDIYRSQADLYGNSFANPMNPANMNPGFGMDPNLLTPSYDAGYRPQYAGPQPYNQYGRVGFFAGINNIMNPAIGDPRYGNPIDNNRQSIEGISSRPFDSVVWAGQRVVAPAVGFGLAFRALARPGMAAGNAVGRGFAGGFAAGMGRFMPNWMAAGVRGALGGGRIAGMAVPGAFGMAGYLAAPLIAGQAAMEFAQATVFDPYINTRRTARDLRDNFAGVTFDDATGNRVTGQGLGYLESTRIGQQITRQGNQDFTFSSGEYSNIADYSARAGLLDDAKARQISQRVKDVAEQIKLVMAIAGDPSIKNAIQQLAQLHQAGASIVGPNSQASQALMTLGQNAAVAGRSVQNIMNTVGAQGQYLYQANGMTPYLGQIAASNIIGSFDVARRNGLLNNSQIARFGGTEGATQASLTGQINATQTLFNKMALYNQYLNGRGGSAGTGPGMRVTDVVSQFGSDFSRDPMGAYGRMMLHSRMLGGRQLDEQGSLSTENQVAAILDSMAVPKNASGQYDASQMMPVLVNMMGMTEDQAAAFIAQRTAETDMPTYMQGTKARNAQTQKMVREYVSQNYLYGGRFGSTMRGVRNVWNNLKDNIAQGAVEPFTDFQGMFGDAVQGGMDRIQYGSSLSEGYSVQDMNKFINNAVTGQGTPTKGQTLNLLRGGNTTKDGYYRGGRLLSDLGRMGASFLHSGMMRVPDTAKAINRINQIAQGNGKAADDARAFINATSKEEKARALSNLLKNPEMADMAPMLTGAGRSDAARGNFDTFISDTMNFGNYQTTSSGDPGGIQGQLNQTLGIHDKTASLGFLDSINAIGQASDLANRINAGATTTDIDDLLKNGNYKELSTLVGNRTGKDASDYIIHSYKNAVQNGLAQIGALSYNQSFNVDDFKKHPERILDAKERKRFTDAMKAGDETTMQEIVASQLGLHNDGKFVNGGLKGAQDLDLSKVAGYQQQLDVEAVNDSKQYDLVKSGRFDYATTQAIINNNDVKKNNDKFSSAVDKLDSAADKLSDAAERSQNSGSGGNTWSFLPWAGPKTTSDNNQRPAGSPQR